MLITSIIRKYRLACLILTILFFAVACTKNGDPGPKGDTGEIGATGATGPQGPTGATGATGTANVQYSPWISTSFSGSGSLYTGNITATPITQEVLDKADIRVYWSESGRVLTLPYAETFGTVTYTVHQRFYVGRIELRASYSLTSQQFRYVIIPGSVAVRGRLAGIDMNDYNAVKAYFNIPD